MLPGSYHTGFAPRDGYPRFPELWRGCVGAWAPCLGPTGLTLRDWSGRQNHGTLTNMVPGDDWVMASGRYALDFDGSNDYAACATVNGTSGTMSISVWFNRAVVDANFRFICGNANSAGAVIETHLETINNSIGPLWGSGPYYRPSPNLGIVASTWYHVVLLRYGSSGAWTAQIYLNGALVWTDTTSINPGTADVWSIGRTGAFAGAAATYFSGQLDDLMLFNRTLSPAEIRLLSRRSGIAYEIQQPNYYTQPISARRRKILTGQV